MVKHERHERVRGNCSNARDVDKELRLAKLR